MNSDIKIPSSISSLITDGDYQLDNIGMTGSCIRIYKDQVLKIQKSSQESKNEVFFLNYLQGKLPVPKVYSTSEVDGRTYILMGKCKGEYACSPNYMKDPITQIKMLADGLKKLWSIEISECITDNRLSVKLQQAENNIKNGDVNISTFGENGFESPSHLLNYLIENKPENEELAFSHGDFCLPNIFGIGEKVTGFIDLGRAGIADKWCDVALCYRSIKDNFEGKYSNNNAGINIDKNLLCSELGIEPDWEKINYYILLDELF